MLLHFYVFTFIMQLFKRILLSLFPDEMMANNINPASMFISFISTKEFFSVINRKIIENYKLNLFDIAIDPFEFKIWFWEKQNFKPKDIDAYYWYCWTANMNWYRFLNPSNTANTIALTTSIYTKDIFSKYPEDYLINFLYAIYLLTFVFLARIKIFPHQKKQDNYNRFIETFFSFYRFVFEQTWKVLDEKIFKNIQKELLSQIEIFFMLFYYYQKINWLLYNNKVSDTEFYWRIFYDELRDNEIKDNISKFIQSSETQTINPNFGELEKSILQYILPADILLKYLFLENDMGLIIENIVSKLRDKKTLSEYLKTFRKDWKELENLLIYLTDYRNFKKNFFTGVQKYIVTIFRSNKNWDFDEEMEEFMSSIWEDIENIESFKIPERVKKESKIMEKILNFYITLIWWFWISRWDSFFVKMFRKDIITDFLNKDISDNDTSLYYYGTLLYQYGKNVFYYKYTTDNLRQWKQKFFLPYKSDSKKIYSNMCILKLFDENFIWSFLQDINPKDIKIYIKNKQIIDDFKSIFGKEISLIVKKDWKEFIEKAYSKVSSLLKDWKWFTKSLQKNLNNTDISHIKENLYCFDFQLLQSFYKELINKKFELKKIYPDPVILWIFSNLRETLFWLLIYMKFLELKNKKNNIESLIKIYIQDIINIQTKDKLIFENIIKWLLEKFSIILQKWISIDDNKEVFELLWDNRIKFIDNKTPEEIIKSISWEDIIRFKWFLKNINYYNKRFIIPN